MYASLHFIVHNRKKFGSNFRTAMKKKLLMMLIDIFWLLCYVATLAKIPKRKGSNITIQLRYAIAKHCSYKHAFTLIIWCLFNVFAFLWVCKTLGLLL